MKKFVYNQLKVSSVCLTVFFTMMLAGIDPEIILPIVALAAVVFFFRPPDTTNPMAAIIFTALMAAFSSAFAAHLAVVVVIAIIALVVVSCNPELFWRSEVKMASLCCQFGVLYCILTGSTIGFGTARMIIPTAGAFILASAFFGYIASAKEEEYDGT